jgi:hypothetical protein
MKAARDLLLKRRRTCKLPKAEHDAQDWQAAMQALLLVADTRRERCDEPQLDCVSV